MNKSWNSPTQLVFEILTWTVKIKVSFVSTKHFNKVVREAKSYHNPPIPQPSPNNASPRTRFC